MTTKTGTAGQRGQRHEPQQRAEAGGHALAAAEAEEDGPAVAGHRRHAAAAALTAGWSPPSVLPSHTAR